MEWFWAWIPVLLDHLSSKLYIKVTTFHNKHGQVIGQDQFCDAILAASDFWGPHATLITIND